MIQWVLWFYTLTYVQLKHNQSKVTHCKSKSLLTLYRKSISYLTSNIICVIQISKAFSCWNRSPGWLHFIDDATDSMILYIYLSAVKAASIKVTHCKSKLLLTLYHKSTGYLMPNIICVIQNWKGSHVFSTWVITSSIQKFYPKILPSNLVVSTKICSR